MDDIVDIDDDYYWALVNPSIIICCRVWYYQGMTT